MTTIYLAAPLFTHAERQWNNQLAARLRSLGFDVIAPQEQESVDAGETFSRNVACIDRAHLLVAILDGADPDSGTCWECGYAFHAGKPVIGVRTDFRAGGDDGQHSLNLMLSRSCQRIIQAPAAECDGLAELAVQVAAAVQTASHPLASRLRSLAERRTA